MDVTRPKSEVDMGIQGGRAERSMKAEEEVVVAVGQRIADSGALSSA